MIPEHGTRARYSRGCRCDDCRAANTAADRAYRARAGIPDPVAVPVRDWTAPAPKGKVAAKLEDLEFLLSVGEAPERALQRVGWQLETARTACRRHGRHDLAAHLRERVTV